MTAHDRLVISSAFSITHQDNPGKYLGYPVFKGRPNIETFSELVSKTASKLQTWKTKNISKARRVALIQANIEAMPAHTMQCFNFLVLLTRKLIKLVWTSFGRNHMTPKTF